MPETDPPTPSPSRDIPQELLDLRTQIDVVDHQMLALLAKRKDIVTLIADVKKCHTIEIRDRTRESKILEDRRGRCDSLGLSNEVIESLYRVILTASRDLQASLGAEVPSDLETRTVAIIGGLGGMGSLFGRLFEELGQEVLIADLETTLTPREAASRADAVLISVPIRDTLEVIADLGPRCRADALLFDLTSTKVAPVEAMCTHSECDVIGTHPIFGPNIHTLQDQRIVLVPARLREGSPWESWLKTCLRARGLSILESSADEHDRSMAIVQVLTHFSTEVLGLAMARIGVPVTETLRFASPVYLIELIMTARHFCQSAELYGQIHMANPNRIEIADTLQASLDEWRAAVDASDQDAFESLFSETNEFFGEFSARALDQSAFLIDRLVERG